MAVRPPGTSARPGRPGGSSGGRLPKNVVEDKRHVPWLPEGWLAVKKISSTGLRYNAFLSPDGRLLYHRAKIAELHQLSPNTRGRLPPERWAEYPPDAYLKCTTKSERRRAKHENLKTRCREAHGRKIGDVLGMTWTHSTGRQRPYNLMDLKYDIQTGFLQVLRGPAAPLRGRKRRADAQLQASARRRLQRAGSTANTPRPCTSRAIAPACAEEAEHKEKADGDGQASLKREPCDDDVAAPLPGGGEQPAPPPSVADGAALSTASGLLAMLCAMCDEYRCRAATEPDDEEQLQAMLDAGRQLQMRKLNLVAFWKVFVKDPGSRTADDLYAIAVLDEEIGAARRRLQGAC